MMKDVWFRWLVWLDFRLAILFTLIIPLGLFIWAFGQKNQTMQHLLAIYWRVASLFAITLYLAIAQYQLSFISGLMARILIPLSLWFWVDLNDEIEYQPNSFMKLVFTSWRWATTLYCALGAIASIPFVGCAFSSNTLKSNYCQVWFEAPLVFKEIFHKNTTANFLGILGILGLILYIIFFGYFVIFKLGKQGRTAIEQ
ncbi:DUF3177 family protein [Calothrix sp. UHCC 0171]|uniref:DUF3177 family protein n=1 Tax=Calothrix sp. UHCC 0171 TaxID=3110245 RepID=UPI002B21FD8D|nr:DUF3177 family protein [Calothrix sp. UHCC 0171]MEA5571168.1 DUF3177 family protein [Calothrix sp. UHCC 0171]